ncbi:peroxiredoxin [Vibrio nigripulchritudo]|uniref:OsmC family protein n=1 Tax=Vibrio nigripulchritudo TaxID=28173 RepID=UPI00190D4808|nr:OsmC family protein [Vibrio nigripulchritudo]BCL69259.1 peroxiredoxin [Vibrio nigripulchritudo]BDU30593.1 peroxiredoxin [Vibrio nigripulchritudo]
MTTHRATVHWQKLPEQPFTDSQFSRVHTWEFDGGVCIPASPSPEILPPPLSDESAVDPEEAYIATLSSCHMMAFLAIAAKRKYVVEQYRDTAQGVLSENENGKLWVSKVCLCPDVQFSGDKIPSPEQVQKLHKLAHKNCFIANSVKTAIEISSAS